MATYDHVPSHPLQRPNYTMSRDTYLWQVSFHNANQELTVGYQWNY